MLIFGGWGLGGGTLHNPSYGTFTSNDSEKLLKYVYENGIFSFDTSPAYGNGKSEQRIGNFIVKNLISRDKVHISSKVGFINNFERLSLNNINIITSLNDTLQRLKSNYLDILYLHSPDEYILKDNLKDIFETMSHLKRKNKIIEWGISLKKPSDIDLIDSRYIPDAIQVNFNILDRRILETTNFNIFLNKSVKFYARTPFCSGFVVNHNIYREEINKKDHRSNLSYIQKKNLCVASRFMLWNVNGVTMDRDGIGLSFIKSYNQFSGIVLGSLIESEWRRNINIYNNKLYCVDNISIYNQRYSIVKELLEKK
jgi:aryl-alcohol dehydrogenase-like predicted oxidoreductase